MAVTRDGIVDDGGSGGATGGISHLKTYYVGKHGNDSNAGKNPDAPFLTFGSATAAATAAGDVIWCLDGGTYNESIVLAANVSLIAPAATVTTPGGGGTGVGCVVSNGGDPYISVKKLIPGSGNSGVVQNDFAGTINVDVDVIDLRSGGVNGLLNLASVAGGVMMARCRQIYVDASGVGVGSSTQNIGHIHLDSGDIYLAGNSAIGIFLGTPTTIVGRVDHILKIGSPTGTVGIDVNSGEVSLSVSDLAADTVYDVSSGATLNLFANKLTGAVGGGTGTANVTTP